MKGRSFRSSTSPGYRLARPSLREFTELAERRGHYPSPPSQEVASVGFFVLLLGAGDSAPLDDKTYFVVSDVQGSAVPRWRTPHGALAPGDIQWQAPSIVAVFEEFLDSLEYDEFASDDRIRLDVEEFVRAWSVVAETIALSADDRRVADALARMAAEVVQTEGPPPREPLRAAMRWFAAKADLFATNAAEAAGKTTGHAMAAGGAAGAAAATGQLPRLLDALGRLVQQLN